MLNQNISVDRAINIILSCIKEAEEEKIHFADGLGRYLSRDIISGFSVPFFDNSAMDGFALRAEEIKDASKDNPVKLKIVDEIWAGKIARPLPDSKCCVKIYTGAMIPDGADCVVRQEDVTIEGDYALFFNPVEKGNDIRLKGEEIKENDVVASKGSRITPAMIGLFASLMKKEIYVYKKPKIAILATGSELIDIDEQTGFGKIVNSNSYALMAMAREAGAEAFNGGIIKDNRDELEKAFYTYKDTDLVITTGGVSVGEYDLVKDVFANLGVNWLFWKVRMRPGHPVAFGVYNNRLFFALPGNPVSAMVTFDQFVLPAIKKFFSAPWEKKTIYAIATDDIRKKSGRTHFLRGRAYTKDGELFVDIFPNQASSAITSMTLANCYVILKEDNTRINKGEKVLIELFEN